MQPPPNRDGPADGKVELREFLPRRIRRRVDRRAVFINKSPHHIKLIIGNYLCYQTLRLAAAGAIADGGELYPVGLYRGKEEFFRFIRLVGVYNKVTEVFPGIVKADALRAGAYSGVNAQNPRSLYRLLHKEVFQILAEYADAVGIGVVSLVAAYLAEDCRRQKPARAVLDRLAVVFVARRVNALQHRRRRRLVDVYRHV